MTAWFDAATYPGCAWGAAEFADAEQTLGRPIVTTHAISAPFDPDGYDWQANLDLLTGGGSSPYGHPVTVMLHLLGVRTVDPTWPPGGLADVAARTPYVRSCLAKWATLLGELPAPTLARMWHEMNDAGNIWGRSHTDPATYIAAWRVVDGYFRRHGVRDKVRLVWCQGGHLSKPSFAGDYFPGDGVVDWVGWDAYSLAGNGCPSVAAMQSIYSAAAAATSRPLMVCELGIDEACPNRVANINAMLPLLKAMPRVKSVTYFGHVDDQPAGSLAAFEAWTHDAYMTPTLAMT